MNELVLIMLGSVFGFGAAWAIGRQALRGEKMLSAQKDAMILNVEEQKHNVLDELQAAREKLIRLEVEKESSLQQIAQGKDDLKKMEAVFMERFENLSNRIFNEKTEVFKKQSQESLGELLNPLRERMREFQDKVDKSFGEQAKEQFSLKNEIKNMVETHSKMSVQAENLTNALKGDTKVQGNWGEVILEKILEESGLRKGMNYSVQGGGLNLRDGEGRLQKPDVIVNLPEGKHVIIDSKVSLTHYERFYSENEEQARGLHIKQFLGSVRKHAEELGARRYQDSESLGTPDFVLMFIPIEGAYMLAVQEDPEIHSYAWGKKVVIVCPTTLFATLKTITSVWRLELQNRNAQDIAKAGGDLYDKIAGFVEDMDKIGKQIKTVEGTYEQAMNKLKVGKGNILGRTEKLRALGVKTSKSLPSDVVAFEDDDNDSTAPIVQDAA